MSLYYNRETGVGMAVWQGQVQGAEFREAVLLCLELMGRFELRGWLSDNRKVTSVNLNDLQWSLKVIGARVAAIPLLRLARLPSEIEEIRNAVGVMVNEELDFASNRLFRNFENVQEAMQWLTESIKK